MSGFSFKGFETSFPDTLSSVRLRPISPSASPRPRSETTGRTPHGRPQRGRPCDRPAARPPGPRRAPFPGRDIIVRLPSPPFGRASLFFYIYNPDVSSAWPAHLSRNSDVLSRLQRGARPGALLLTGRPPFDDPGAFGGRQVRSRAREPRRRPRAASASRASCFPRAPIASFAFACLGPALGCAET